MTDDLCRQAFEKNFPNWEKDKHGDYIDEIIYGAWVGWKAAWKARGEHTCEPCNGNEAFPCAGHIIIKYER